MTFMDAISNRLKRYSGGGNPNPTKAEGHLASIGGSGALPGLHGGSRRPATPEQAEAVSSEGVDQLATHADNADPAIVDRASSSSAQHPTLIKTLGNAALAIALAKVAQRPRAA